MDAENAAVGITKRVNAVLLATARISRVTLTDCVSHVGIKKNRRRKKRTRRFANTAEGSSERKMA